MENRSRPSTAAGEWGLDRQGERNYQPNLKGPKGSWRLLLSFVIENFIEIIIDSHEVVSNNSQRVSLCAFCPFPPVVRFCTIVIPQSGYYISTIHGSCLEFPSYACTHACAVRVIRLCPGSFAPSVRTQVVPTLQGTLDCSLLVESCMCCVLSFDSDTVFFFSIQLHLVLETIKFYDRINSSSLFTIKKHPPVCVNPKSFNLCVFM